MVKRILSFVGKEISGLHEAAYLLALSMIASLVFALVRDRLLANIIGPGITLDVYYAAFRIPDFIFVTAASLVSTSILVPFFAESLQKGKEELKSSIQNLFSAFLALILILCAVVFVFMRPIQELIFPNLFAQGVGDVLVSTSRILLLSPILLGLAGFFTSITQVQNRFMVYAISSPLYNIGIICGILFFLPKLGVQGLGWGVALGALLLSLAQIPIVISDGLFPKFKLSFDWKKIRHIAKLSIPRTITLSSQQITSLSLVSFASFLAAGSISIFNLSLNLQSVPLGIIGASYSSAAFPVLAKLYADKRHDEFLSKMIAAARHIIFWSVPISVLFIVLRAQIVRTVLGSGQFTWSDTRLTAAALALFVISSAGQSLMLLFVRSFYAEGKTAKPLVINVISTIVTIVFGFLLVKAFHVFPFFSYFIESLMKTDGSVDSSVLMLPLAFSAGALLNLYLHWDSFAKQFPAFTAPVRKTFVQILSSSIIGGYLAYTSLRFLDDIFSLTTTWGVFLQGLCAGLIGIAGIIVILSVLKSEELRDVKEALKHKVWKVDRSSLDQMPS